MTIRPKKINAIGYLQIGALRIQVRATQVRRVYGNIRYLVEPIAGRGETWTEKVKFPPKRD